MTQKLQRSLKQRSAKIAVMVRFGLVHYKDYAPNMLTLPTSSVIYVDTGNIARRGNYGSFDRTGGFGSALRSCGTGGGNSISRPWIHSSCSLGIDVLIHRLGALGQETPGPDSYGAAGPSATQPAGHLHRCFGNSRGNWFVYTNHRAGRFD